MYLRSISGAKSEIGVYVLAPRLLPWNQTVSGSMPIRLGLARSVIIRRPWGRAQVVRWSGYHTGTYTVQTKLKSDALARARRGVPPPLTRSAQSISCRPTQHANTALTPIFHHALLAHLATCC